MPTGYGALVSAIGVGAAAAALFMAATRRRTRRARLVLVSCVLFGVVLDRRGAGPGFWSALVLFTVAGCLMALNGIVANTMLQLQAPDRLRGRVMGFYSFVVLGMAPFGSLQAGWVAEHFGVRTAVAIGGLACVLMAALVGFATRRGARPATSGHPERSEGPSLRVSGTPEQDPSLRSG